MCSTLASRDVPTREIRKWAFQIQILMWLFLNIHISYTCSPFTLLQTMFSVTLSLSVSPNPATVDSLGHQFTVDDLGHQFTVEILGNQSTVDIIGSQLNRHSRSSIYSRHSQSSIHSRYYRIPIHSLVLCDVLFVCASHIMAKYKEYFSPLTRT